MRQTHELRGQLRVSSSASDLSDQAKELRAVVLPSNGAVGCRGVSGSAAPGRSSLRRAASSRMLPCADTRASRSVTAFVAKAS
jgi:hypothetical protein